MPRGDGTTLSGSTRLLVAALVLALLGRAAVGAWRHRELAVTVWRSAGARQLVGGLALIAAVATVGTLLLALPPLRFGLGEVVGSVGNAVFTPLEEAVVRAGPPPETGPDWVVIALSTVFLAFLVALLPWLAFVEEEIFRAGLEHARLGREVWAAVKFGLVHMAMLVPLGAALAIAVAGFVYGRIYRRAYAHAGAPPAHVVALYRPTKRARRAAATTRLRAVRDEGAGGLAVLLNLPEPEHQQAAGVFASTVWHTTFNTMVVTLLWVAIVWGAWS